MGQMSAEERQESIVDEVLVNGRVSVTALAERHSVTVETIRRDLTALDRRGALRKVHGGAVATSAVAAPETAVIEREQSHAQAKRAMARVAVGALDLGAGDRLILDAGTSVAALVPLLPPGMPLTIVTSSVLTASALAPQEHLSVRILGGQVRGLTQAAVGPEALATLATLRVDTAVIGANGLSARHGLSTPDPEEAATKRAMVAAADRVVVLLDSSKVGQEHLVSFAPLDAIDVLVTDRPLPTSLHTAITTTGAEVLTT